MEKLESEMPVFSKLKIVYLFGAGATHAEVIELNQAKASDAKFLAEGGLLMDAVSKSH
ncbi:MAG: hypothetical protein ACLQSR_03690 [Limisphaerales bacterium]